MTRDALLILPLDLHGPRSRLDLHQVLGRQDLALRRADQHVVDVRDLLAVLLAQPDDDRILVAALAETARPACRRRWSGSCWRRRTRSRRAAPPSAGPPDRQLGPPLVAADARVGDARRAVHDRLGVLREALRVGRSWPRISTATRRVVRPPPPMNRFIWLLPPDGLARMMTPGRPRSWRRRANRDLFVRALALVAGHQDQHGSAAMAGRRRHRRPGRRRRAA